MGKTIAGTFRTRREAELAVEHLVQEYGLERADIFIEPTSGENSAGAKASGGDTKAGNRASRSTTKPALNGNLVVSVDVNDDERGEVQKVFQDLGALHVAER